jgi:hypothetical protein
MVGRMSLFLSGKIARILDQIDLFWFINPPKLDLLTSRRQTLERHVAPPELHAAATLSELFLIEKQSVWTLCNDMGEPNG